MAAFSDEAIRAIVQTAEFSDPRAERMLGDILIARRDKILQAYLPAVTPLADFALGADGNLRFTNVAANYKVAEVSARGYKAAWFTFDNLTQQATPLGETSNAAGGALGAPAGLPTAAGAYIRVDVAASGTERPAWATPVQVFFRREVGGWTLVGVER